MAHPAISITRYSWRYVKGRRIRFLLTILFFIIADAILLLEPAVLGRMFNVIQQGGETGHLLQSVLKYLLIIFAIPFGFWAFHGVARVLERQNAFYIFTNYKQALLEQIFHLPLSWHRDHHSGENINKINRASRALYDFSGKLFEPINTIVKTFGAYIALLLIMPFAGGVAIIITIIALTVVVLYDRVLMKQYQEIYEKENQAAAVVHDFVSNIVTVVALRLEKFGIKKMLGKIQNVYPVFRKNIILNEIKWFNVNVFVSLMVVGVLGSYVFITLKSGGVLLVGTLYALYAYLDKISSSFWDFAWQYSQIIEFASSVRASEDITADFKKHKPVIAYDMPKNWHDIRISKLYFKYTDQEKQQHQLENIDIEFKRGQKVAIVGSSGGGKSTLMALLRGLYRTGRVQVYVDSKRMPNRLNHLYNQIALLPQEPEIFADTILYNITMGQNIDREKVEKVLQISRFSPVVKRLPRGLQTNIAEKGVNLSGGEKQRLALARGLLTSFDKSIVLMDEPTSSVDVHNEMKIYESIMRECVGKTVLSSIHRLHLLRMFDYIYLIDGGKIIEEGSLEDLLAKRTVLFTMWTNYFKSHRQMEDTQPYN